MQQIDLRTNDDSKLLQMKDIEKLRPDGYRCVLCVRSGGSSCERPFYFDDSSFPDAVAALRTMNASLAGATTIKGRWEEDFIYIEANEFGHVFVSGEIVEYAEIPQRLKFGFQTDQTVLGPLVRDFESLL
jgi:hypothetical protein